MTIEVENADYEYDQYYLVIPIDKILYCDKEQYVDMVRIHLINGEILYSNDSLKTIQAKIDLAESYYHTVRQLETQCKLIRQAIASVG